MNHRPHTQTTTTTTPSRARRFVRATPIALAALTTLAAPACTSASDDAERATEEPVGNVTQALNSGFRLPFKCGFNTTVTQGNNSSFSHVGESAWGYDFGVVVNTPLVAARAGVVTFARNDVKPGNPCYSGGGPSCASILNYVTVKHSDGTSTVYAHINAATVSVGQTVAQGQQIGLSGGTGWSTGPHTHVQRQQNCPYFYCQSIPMSFDDVAGNGMPVAGQAVKSQNTCADVDCAIGDGHYCGGNGVKGDTTALFLCTGGVPKKVQSCMYGCKAMPPGVDDRCATAEEAPPVDAGPEPQPEDGGSEALPPAATPSDDAPAPGTSTDRSASPRTRDEAPPLAADSCATSPRTTTRSVVPALLLAGVMLASVRRRRLRAAPPRRP